MLKPDEFDAQCHGDVLPHRAREHYRQLYETYISLRKIIAAQEIERKHEFSRKWEHFYEYEECKTCQAALDRIDIDIV